MSRYDTNLASEFYVLSCLHRRGLTANLTLGNKKSVDIVIVSQSGDVLTVDVKGVARKYDWPVGNLTAQYPQQHFVVLVSFEGQIDDPGMPAPRVWIIPFSQIAPFVRVYKSRTNVSRAAVVADGVKYENAWHLIEGVDQRKSLGGEIRE